MTIHLSDQLVSRLSELAHQEGRDLERLVEDAVRRYLEDAAITDVTPEEIAETQDKLVPELINFEPWDEFAESGHDEA